MQNLHKFEFLKTKLLNAATTDIINDKLWCNKNKIYNQRSYA